MRVVVQRVTEASVKVDGRLVSSIGRGLMVLLGITHNDTQQDADYLCGKLAKMRIFADTEGVMNRAITEENGEFLVVSQFTLHASTKKGNRPSYMRAAHPSHAVPLYEYFLEKLWMDSNQPVKSGIFGAQMKVSLVNDGPVTISIDSQQKE